MSMYLVSDNELNTIIRLRRQDVLKFLTEVQEQNPQATFDELVHATSHFFAAQAVQFDYLADYTQEEIAYGLIEPEPEPELEPVEEAPVDTEDDEVEPESVAPVVDESLTVVDDTIQIVDEEPVEVEAPVEDVNPEPAAEELVPDAPVGEVAVVNEDNAAEVAQRDDRAAKISLRALQRELRQIDKA